MRYLFIALLTSTTLFSANLTFSNGFVEAQTSIFGDSNINPSSSNIVSYLSMDKGDVTTLKGTVDVSLVDLKSDNGDRDEHMHKVIDSEKYTTTTFTINSVVKNSEGSYTIHGKLNLHGISRELNLLGVLQEHDNSLRIKAKTSFNMSAFGIEPPTLLFLKVRDRLQMTINTTYTIEP